MATVAVIAAAGGGARFGGEKQFISMAQKTVLWHAVRPFVESARVDSVVVVAQKEKAKQATEALGDFAVQCRVLPVGGKTRAESICNGIAELQKDDWVLAHDAARPCLPADALARLLDDADEGGAVLALPVVDALRFGKDKKICGVIGKQNLYQMQTPQKFRAGALREALQKFPEAEDEAEAMWRSGVAAKLVDGDARNIKITRREDLQLAEMFAEDLRRNV